MTTAHKKQSKDNISQIIGANIRRLRRDSGMIQAELADRIGICKEPLGCIERGKNAPSARVLHALAEVLQVPVDLLFAESPAKFQALREASLNRPWPILPDQRQITDKVWHLGDSLVDDFLELEQICGAPRNACIPLHLHLQPDEPGMEKLATAVRGFMNIGGGVVFDYCELFENCGFRVIFLPLPDTLDSFSYFDPLNENALFFVNAIKNPEKQLFSLVFELGLLYLRNAPRPQTEPLAAETCLRLARKFAAFFLMPAAAVNTGVDQLGIQPEGWSYELLLRLKHRFGVSAETFLYRLRELGRLGETVYPKLKARIHAHYAETGYAEPDSSRRIITPNARLWDLLTVAASRPGRAAAIAARIEKRLQKKNLPSSPEEMRKLRI